MSKLVSAFLYCAILTLPCLALNYPNESRAEELNNTCKEAVKRISTELASNYNVPIHNISVSRIPDHYRSPFQRSNQQLSIILGSKDVLPPRSSKGQTQFSRIENFLGSPGVQVRLAKQITDSCSNIAMVNFSLMNSGWINSHFRMPSGETNRAIPMECSATNPSITPWGYAVEC